MVTKTIDQILELIDDATGEVCLVCDMPGHSHWECPLGDGCEEE